MSTKKKLLFGGIILAALAAVAFGFKAQTTEAGWWPDRPLRAYHDGVAGFDTPTFNSFTGTSVYGFEPVFYTVKNVTTEGNGPFHDTTSVRAGDTVSFRIYFHNGADLSKNEPNFTGPGVAQNTRVLAALPNGSGTNLTTSAYISASNATPQVIADTATITAADGMPFRLEFIPGSAYLLTNHFTSPQAISDSAVTVGSVSNPAGQGALIGFNALNGIVPGCFEFDGNVFFRARVVPVGNPDLSVKKKVSVNGVDFFDADTEAAAVGVSPGSTVTYALKIWNSGTTTLQNVRVRDVLPPHQTLVAGSADILAFRNGAWTTIPLPASEDSWLFSADGRPAAEAGVSSATFAPGEGVTIHFRALVDAATPGNTFMTNVEFGRAANVPEKSDVAITKTGPPTVPQGEVVQKSKRAFNVTQGVDATTTKSRPGDVVRYTLTTKNAGETAIEDFVVSDDLSDILQYATVTDTGGGSVDGSGTITYPARDLAAGETITNTFTVTVKPSSQWPSGGDQLMVNVYGNRVEVPVEDVVVPFGAPQPSAPQALPTAGAAEAGALGGTIISGLAYLYHRSKKGLLEAIRHKRYQ